MAKRRRGRRSRRGKFQAIPFQQALALSTLADDTVLGVALIGANLGEDYYALSVDAQWAIRDLTAGEGPILVGFAHDDLSVSEVNEAITAEVTDPDDIIAVERSRRPVRKSGVFPVQNTHEVLNDGKTIRTKLKWSIGNDHNLNCWVRNASGAPLTTGAILEITGTLYGNWQR